jgi:lipopolysaccharide transport protein LptA
MSAALRLAAALATILLVAAPVSAQDPPAGKTETAASRLGLWLDRGADMTITADELEAVRDEGGSERVIFQRSVAVEQGELRIRCEWLEAVYPKQRDGGPETITARGKVRIQQGALSVECREAVFDRLQERATCSSSNGRAVLRRGEDVVQGDRIVFDLRQGKVTVRGGAKVVVRSREQTP